MNAYIGVNNSAKSVSKIYVGVGDKAKKVVKGYVGDSGCRARAFFDITPPPEPTGYTFAGRKIYRHSFVPGSVIKYNEFGTEKEIIVVDAIYRGTAQWKTSDTSVSGLKQWNHWYYPTNTGNVIDSDTGFVNLNKVADITPYEEYYTDARFQSALTATLKPVLQTAKAATDLMIADGNCPAAQHCRSRSSYIGAELQLPNIYQTLVMFACGDIIDRLDPTLAAYPTYALGWNGGKNTYRWRMDIFGNTLSSTAYSSVSACSMNYTGGSFYNNKTITFGVAPIVEL